MLWRGHSSAWTRGSEEDTGIGGPEKDLLNDLEQVM